MAQWSQFRKLLRTRTIESMTESRSESCSGISGSARTGESARKAGAGSSGEISLLSSGCLQVPELWFLAIDGHRVLPRVPNSSRRIGSRNIISLRNYPAGASANANRTSRSTPSATESRIAIEFPLVQPPPMSAFVGSPMQTLSFLIVVACTVIFIVIALVDGVGAVPREQILLQF